MGDQHVCEPKCPEIVADTEYYGSAHHYERQWAKLSWQGKCIDALRQEVARLRRTNVECEKCGAVKPETRVIAKLGGGVEAYICFICGRALSEFMESHLANSERANLYTIWNNLTARSRTEKVSEIDWADYTRRRVKNERALHLAVIDWLGKCRGKFCLRW